jgi:hypothetical protein
MTDAWRSKHPTDPDDVQFLGSCHMLASSNAAAHPLEPHRPLPPLRMRPARLPPPLVGWYPHHPTSLLSPHPRAPPSVGTCAGRKHRRSEVGGEGGRLTAAAMVSAAVSYAHWSCSWRRAFVRLYHGRVADEEGEAAAAARGDDERSMDGRVAES